MNPTRENTLYLPIKQIYFDQIMAGTKKEEYREIKEGITANRYLIKDAKTKYLLNPKVTDPSKEYFIDDYNNGNFPFMPKEYQYLNLVVGYAKVRDEAIIKVTGFSFKPEMIRASLYAFWVIVFHLGEVVEVKTKQGRFSVDQPLTMQHSNIQINLDKMIDFKNGERNWQPLQRREVRLNRGVNLFG